jgi:hypothetical protein
MSPSQPMASGMTRTQDCAQAMIADEGTVAQSHDYYESSVNIDY